MVVPMDSEDTTPTVDLWALPTNQERLAEAVDFDGKRVVDVGCGAWHSSGSSARREPTYSVLNAAR